MFHEKLAKVSLNQFFHICEDYRRNYFESSGQINPKAARVLSKVTISVVSADFSSTIVTKSLT